MSRHSSPPGPATRNANGRPFHIASLSLSTDLRRRKRCRRIFTYNRLCHFCSASMLLSLLLAGAACVLTTDAKPDTFTTLLSPSRNLGTGYNVSSAASVVPVPSLTSVHYTFPTTAVLTPSVTSLGAVVTSLVPLYEVCNLAGSDSISCSPSIATIKTASCNTTLVGWYTTVTVSDCTQNVTFSSEKSYALLTTSAVPTATALKRDAASPVPTTVVQSVVSYYITPWQSLAVNDVSDITVLVCTTAWDTGIQTCTEVQEVWVVHVTYVPVYTTKTVSFTTSFSSVCCSWFCQSTWLIIHSRSSFSSTRLSP